VKMLHDGNAQWSYIGKNYFSFDESMFVDFSKMNFTLKTNADVFKKMPEFKAIPFDQIGIRN